MRDVMKRTRNSTMKGINTTTEATAAKRTIDEALRRYSMASKNSKSQTRGMLRITTASDWINDSS